MRPEGDAILQIYTGDGKGKTSSALGQALRALGNGEKVLLVQFLKKGDTSEVKALRKFGKDLVIIQSGPGGLDIPFEEIKQSGIIEQTFLKASSMLEKDRFGLLIMDEINLCLSSGMLKAESVNDFLDRKQGKLEIIMTGRGAPGYLLKRADLVTEMKKIKHHYDKGIKAKKGREF